MNIKSRIAPLLLAGIVALGIATVPAVAADAATSSTQAKVKTGTIQVQVLTPAGKIYKKAGVIIVYSSGQAGDFAKTNSKGIATLKKVPVGSKYTVGNGYEAHKYVLVSKSKVKVTSGKTTKVSLKLALAATITGTVVDTDGSALGGVPVAVHGKRGSVFAFTNSRGAYTVDGLATGSYRVEFNSHASGNPRQGYGVSYWKNASTLDSATVLKATQQTSKKAASTLKKINGVVESVPTGIISGVLNVEDASSVYLQNRETGEVLFTEDVEDVQGGFTATVNAGSYYVFTEVYNSDSDTIVNPYYTGNGLAASPDRDDALLVTVTADSHEEISFGDYAGDSEEPDPSATATVTGSVELTGAETVNFYDTASGEYVATIDVKNGTFSAQVAPGDYYVSVDTYDPESDTGYTYFYTGDGAAVSEDELDAVTVSPADHETLSIVFGALPE